MEGLNYFIDLNGTSVGFPYDPIVVCYRGSHAHGTYIPPEDEHGIDDVDLFCVSIASQEHYFGLKEWEGKDYWVEQYDICSYDIRKFVRLVLKGNPNVVGILWTEEEHILYKTEGFDLLQDHRNLLIGKKGIYDAFCGYARSQFKRMTNFSTDPYRRYMGEKRKKLVNEFGFDVKNAAHLVRLLNMCTEFLTSGQLNVYRTHDADLIKDIKRGKWKLDEVKNYAEITFAEIDALYPLADLPEYPDTKLANQLLVKILEDHFYGYGLTNFTG